MKKTKVWLKQSDLETWFPPVTSPWIRGSLISCCLNQTDFSSPTLRNEQAAHKETADQKSLCVSVDNSFRGGRGSYGAWFSSSEIHHEFEWRSSLQVSALREIMEKNVNSDVSRLVFCVPLRWLTCSFSPDKYQSQSDLIFISSVM